MEFKIESIRGGNLTLFDRHLGIVNKKLEYVNEYYTPKNKCTIVDHSKTIETQNLTKSIDQKNDQSINFYTELHKIALDEIESSRKDYVKSVLCYKLDTLIKKRNKLYNKPINTDKKSKYTIQEGLGIHRNHHDQEHRNNQIEIETLEKIKLEQQTRYNKFNDVLKKAFDLLNVLNELLNKCYEDIPPELLNNLMTEYMEFEIDMKKMNDMNQDLNDYDMLFVNRLLHSMQIFHKKISNSILIEPQDKSDNNIINTFSFKSIVSNDDIMNNSYTNQMQTKEKSEIEKFTFKIDNSRENNLDVFHTFKFNIEKDTDISNDSLKSDNITNNDLSNVNYNFEGTYKHLLDNFYIIQEHLKTVEKTYCSFIHDANLKFLRQELIKAINTPINSLSSSSPWHMKDKFIKLDILLKCKSVRTGNSTVSANSHPSAIIFCKDTLAKKIITTGEQVVSIKRETAFEISSIVTELWQIHPDFGILLYARFKQKCPFLIPYNVSKTDKQTDEEYYKSLGYNYINGVIETQSKYIMRMTGIIRLFAAIVVTESKSGNILGIGQIWILITTTVHLIPQLDITAILLLEVLEITGYYLKCTYGIQFIKLLHYIHINYMKKIEEITPIECNGPVQRLKTFLLKAIQRGYIDKPQGMIPNNFW